MTDFIKLDGFCPVCGDVIGYDNFTKIRVHRCDCYEDTEEDGWEICEGEVVRPSDMDKGASGKSLLRWVCKMRDKWEDCT